MHYELSAQRHALCTMRNTLCDLRASSAAGGEKNKKIVSPQRHRGHRDIIFLFLCRCLHPVLAGETMAKENQSVLRAVIIINIHDNF